MNLNKHKQHFLSKVHKAKGCWLWVGCKNPDGYGLYGAGSLYGERRAHRIMYRIAVGDIPKGLCVCHHCDEPSCVNPAHLFIGTWADNNRDRDHKGRTIIVRGSKQGSAKLSDDKVKEILRLAKCGAHKPTLAKRFGISKTQLYTIVRREDWKHVDTLLGASP